MKKFLFSVFTIFLISGAVFAQEVNKNLIILSDDLRLSYQEGGNFENAEGYHLYIRKKPGIESVMLVETTKDPDGVSDSFSYRAKEYNPVNGDEIRYLNGKILTSEYSKYSLIDSTTEPDEVFGEAFHIYIPSEIVYGYPWERNGTVKIGMGTFINIRSFAKKYGDYTGEYEDNPFMFDLGEPVHKEPEPVLPEPAPLPEPEPIEEPSVAEVPPEPEPAPPEPPTKKEKIILTDDYNPEAAKKFKEIAGFGGGKMIFSKGPETLPEDIMESLDRIDPKTKVDVVFAIDATGSMRDDVKELREVWIPQMMEKVKEFKSIRLGLLLYRDYGDTFKYMNLPVKKFEFTENMTLFKNNLNGFTIKGIEGGDIPEAVFEALYASMEFYKWRGDAERKVILIGDAEPHPYPRVSGKYSKDLIAKLANARGITIDTIIVPDDKSARGR